MRIAHVALWTTDLEGAAAFWQWFFAAVVGAPYESRRRAGFVSRFAQLPGGGATIELMGLPGLVAAPRTTSDRYYEAVVAMPDGTRVEVVA